MKTKFIGKEIPESALPFAYLLGAVALLGVITVVYGFNTTVDSKCRTKTISCHGIPTEDGCLGVETKNVDFVEKDECIVTEQVENLCRKIRTRACANSSKEVMEEAKVFGKSCMKWEEIYDLGIKKCS